MRTRLHASSLMTRMHPQSRTTTSASCGRCARSGWSAGTRSSNRCSARWNCWRHRSSRTWPPGRLMGFLRQCLSRSISHQATAGSRLRSTVITGRYSRWRRACESSCGWKCGSNWVSTPSQIRRPMIATGRGLMTSLRSTINECEWGRSCGRTCRAGSVNMIVRTTESAALSVPVRGRNESMERPAVSGDGIPERQMPHPPSRQRSDGIADRAHVSARDAFWERQPTSYCCRGARTASCGIPLRTPRPARTTWSDG
jgi:hypothetical protein